MGSTMAGIMAVIMESTMGSMGRNDFYFLH